MQRVPLCSISRLSSPVRQAKRLQERRKYYYKDTNIDDVVDNLDSQEQIKKQIALIEEEIENVGKVCDRRQINSEKEFSDKIEEERKELDHQIMKSLETLEELLNQYKIAKETDYKSIYKNITQNLKKISKEINDQGKILFQNQNKKQILEEEDVFLTNELEYAREMNLYLNYKIKNFNLSPPVPKNSNTNTLSDKESPNKNVVTTNNSTSPTSITPIEILQKKTKKIVKNNRYGSSKEGGLLITTVNSPKEKNKKTQIQTEEGMSIEEVKYNFDMAEKKINCNLKQINKEITKKKEIYKKVKSASSNVYQTTMKSIINDIKLNLPRVNKSENYHQKNSYSYLTNSTNGISDMFFSNIKLNKLDKKEIMIQFLENRQVKNMIYGFLYN